MFLRLYSHTKLSALAPLRKGTGRIAIRLFGNAVDVSSATTAKVAQLPVSKYTGETVKGKRHGRGKLIFDSGAVLEGEFKNNSIYNGSGILVTREKNIYEGVWVKGRLQGQAKIVNADGTVLEGEFKDGAIFNGSGVWIRENGTRYEGTWVVGKREGQGKTTSTDGFVYVGEFSQDRKHGVLV